MSALLRLLMLVPAGFVLAVAAAGLVVALSVFGLAPTEETAAWLLLYAAWTAVWAGALSLLPWLVAAVLAEGFGLRSVWFWLIVGGATGAIAPVLAGFHREVAHDGSGIAVHLAAGFVAGFVYWLVAGRRAGQGLVRR